jgi:DNA-binding NarL/FixJ family response regulator
MMPLINGVEATRQIRARAPKTEVLILTAHEDERLIAELLKAGARGYLLKSDLTAQLLDAITSLAKHEPFFTSAVSETLLATFLNQQPRERLNEGERTVLRLVAEGYTNGEIANILEVALKTVESRRAKLMRKLNLSTAAALVLYAIRCGVVEP